MATTEPRRGLSSRLRFDTPERRALHVAVAAAVAISGLTVAILASASPSTRISALATSGAFYALAVSGETLYAASDNGGSIVLERSGDRGIDWAASPVPYSAVAGGAPWTHAAVAVDGPNLILAASSGGVSYPYYPFPAPGPVYATTGCGSNSTILIASSANDGRTWTTVQPIPSALAITSLQVSVVGSSAAVAWLGASTSCSAASAQVQTTTSVDGGQSWSSVQPLRVGTAIVPTGEQVEMAPASEGIALAFGLTSTSDNSSQLGFFRLAPDSGAGFVPIGILPAPASWTLQGSPETPAYLLTPTYLVPLTSPPYTALPFDQLQADAGPIGALPTVVSLVPLAQGRVEVASTTSDNLGVDCWQVDTIALTVTRTCHVPLGSLYVPSSQLRPIVALLDGGGWWVAIGASGSPTLYGGSGGGGNVMYPPTTAGPAVGTSVCVTGCSSAQGLVAYSYAPSSGAAHDLAISAAGLIATTGLAWLAIAGIAGRRGSRAQVGTGGAGEAGRRWAGRSNRGLYRGGLMVWALVWVPLAVLLFALAPGDGALSLPALVVVSAVVGAAISIPLHGVARSRILKAPANDAAAVVAGAGPFEPGSAMDHAQRAATLAYGSWAAGAAMLLAGSIGLWAGMASAPVGSTPPPVAVPIGGLIVAPLVVVFGVLRALFHRELALASAADRGAAPAGRTLSGEDRRALLRTRVGALLLPWNPFLGLVLGGSLGSILPGGPYLISLAFLPVTYVGIAFLTGCFGPSAWTVAADGAVGRFGPRPLAPGSDHPDGESAMAPTPGDALLVPPA